jgi:sugar phosphate isomerase/epimerase/protein-tyrosine-phosphatase
MTAFVRENMFEKAQILFVCTAGAGLSRTAKSFVQAKLARAGAADEYRLDSAVLASAAEWRPPTGEHDPAELARRSDSSSRPLTPELVGQADLILVMSEAERRAVLGEFEWAAQKTFLLTEMVESRCGASGLTGPSQQSFDGRRQEMEALLEASFESILQRANSARETTMARVGLSTVIFVDEQVPPSLPDTLDLFRRARVRFVDWCHDFEDNRIYATAEMDHFAELLQAKGLRCRMVHGVDNSEAHAVTQGEALDRYVAIQGNRVELCARLGGDAVVVHLPGFFWDDSRLSLEQAMEHTTAALDRLRPLCESLGVTLAVENNQRGLDFERLDFYFERYPPSFMTFCLDAGHANRTGRLEGLKAYAPRLSALHLHDNRETEDEHQPPFFGTVDWAGLLGWLLKINYRKPLNFEVALVRPLFTGGPAEFVDYAAQRIRQALSLVPALTHGPGLSTEDRLEDRTSHLIGSTMGRASKPRQMEGI